MGGDADNGRDEPGSVACDWLLGTMPVFRGGSVTELDGSCPDEACGDEGCRSSFIDAEPVGELDDGKPADEDGCEGRGAAWDDDGSEAEGCAAFEDDDAGLR